MKNKEQWEKYRNYIMWCKAFGMDPIEYKDFVEAEDQGTNKY